MIRQFERKLKRALAISDFQKTKYGFVRHAYRTARMRFNWMLNPYPNQIMVETNRRCNLKCTYCAAHQMLVTGKLKPKEMNMADYRGVLWDIKLEHKGVQVVGIGGMQEPLLDQLLPSRIEVARNFFPKALLAITTNGTLLTREAGKELIGNIDGMCVSLNSFDPECYHELNGADEFVTVFDNLTQFLKMKGSQKPAVEIQLLNTDKNRVFFNSFVAYWQGLITRNDKLKLHDVHSWGGNLNGFNVPNYMTKRHPCVQAFDYLYVDAEGDCYPCCLGEVCQDLNLGNIYQTHVKDLLHSDKLRLIRAAHLYGKPELWGSCGSCQTWREKYSPFFKVGSRWV